MADNTPPLRVRAGDVYTLVFTWREPTDDAGHPGDPIDITGFTFVWHVQVGAITADYTSAPEVVPATDRTTGVVTLRLPGAVTATFVTDSGRHWLIGTSPGGDPTTLLIGDVDVSFRK